MNALKVRLTLGRRLLAVRSRKAAGAPQPAGRLTSGVAPARPGRPGRRVRGAYAPGGTCRGRECGKVTAGADTTTKAETGPSRPRLAVRTRVPVSDTAAT